MIQIMSVQNFLANIVLSNQYVNILLMAFFLMTCKMCMHMPDRNHTVGFLRAETCKLVPGHCLHGAVIYLEN